MTAATALCWPQVTIASTYTAATAAPLSPYGTLPGDTCRYAGAAATAAWAPGSY